MANAKYEEPLSPAAQLFHSPSFNCYIVAIIGTRTRLDPVVIKQGLKTLINHPRFSSKLVTQGRKMRWARTTVNVDNHVIIPDLDAELENPKNFVEDYISHMTTQPLDLSKPLWELHLLNVKTSEAEAVGVLRIHHSIGDGASLISLLLACTRKTRDPEALPSVPVQKNEGPGGRAKGVWWVFLAIWSGIMLIWNSVVDLIMFSATTLFLKDTKTPLKGDGPGNEHAPKRFVHRTLDLEDIKLVKNAMNMTVNDVLLGVTQAALSRYLDRIDSKTDQDGGQKSSNHPRNIRLRASALVNLRPTTGIQALAEMMEKGSKCRWGNKIGYVLLPFKIGLQNDPLNYVHGAKATMDRKKLSLEALCTYSVAKFVLKAFGCKVGAATAVRVLSNTTMAFSNVVGPSEEISFYGHPIAYIAPSVYGHPQALTIHFQSYVNKMSVVIAADPDVIPHPHQICEDVDESLQIIKKAALDAGRTNLSDLV
ncbi:wax ester synthase/diacylglycerol acyltransferase 11-like [Mangifera indica]|uniref:wax ester synthase/diacylglycerol acyltransferase 11-like n=1 Tax=Mangifera indica TaxID=29780 RepID=UPI001CFA4007|nr:wax ester synthase/diacylglycerol acyltransferase 11-like [Mangifera indica]